jgi:hypothetical protein
MLIVYRNKTRTIANAPCVTFRRLDVREIYSSASRSSIHKKRHFLENKCPMQEKEKKRKGKEVTSRNHLTSL